MLFAKEKTGVYQKQVPCPCFISIQFCFTKSTFLSFLKKDNYYFLANYYVEFLYSSLRVEYTFVRTNRDCHVWRNFNLVTHVGLP